MSARGDFYWGWADFSRRAAARCSPAAQLVARVSPVIRRVVRRVVGPGDSESEDIVQSSFERWLAWLGDEAIRDERRVTHLAAVMARNVAVDVVRARSSARRVLVPEGASTRETDGSADPSCQAPDPERLAGASEGLEHFARALSLLPCMTAEVLYLHEVLELDLGEISRRLGISVAAAQSRLSRGRHRFTACLRDGFGRT